MEQKENGLCELPGWEGKILGKASLEIHRAMWYVEGDRGHCKQIGGGSTPKRKRIERGRDF